jgi:sugar lactone lactonase YvrE
VLSNGNIVDGNSAIWKYSGGSWTQQPGVGAQLAGSFDPNSNPVPGVGTLAPNGYLVLTALGSIYYYSPGTGYLQFPGAASSVAPATGGVFALAYPPALGADQSVFYFDYALGAWTPEPGSGVSLAAGSGGTGTQLYIVNSASSAWTTAITPAGLSVFTLAGSGNADFADGQGANASFNDPKGIAVDGNGNVYVGDYVNQRIRKVTPSGLVSTLAGSGSRAFSDGQGESAGFNFPTGVAVDGAGNVYVADEWNHSIRKITPSGLVSTIAGTGAQGYTDGQGTSAQFRYPTGVAVDGAGYVYVSDSSNGVIRKITPSGLVSTLAGGFNYPRGIAVDGAGYVYVADEANSRICKITPSGQVSVLAGSGNIAYSDGQGTSASFYYPSGVAVDRAGNVFVVDGGNQRIRKITASGLVSTLAGNGDQAFADGPGPSASFHSPYGVAVDGAGSLYVTDTANNRIRKIH